MNNWAIDVEALYERYEPMVLRRCRRLLEDEDEAQDVAQEVFVRLLKHSERLSGRYPSSLLYRIATNLSLNRLRDRNRRPRLVGEDVLHRIATSTDLDAPLLVDRLLGRQPESTRTMAVLHYIDGMTLAQVAREFAMSVSGVRKRLRALKSSSEAEAS